LKQPRARALVGQGKAAHVVQHVEISHCHMIGSSMDPLPA
jgi:hypothetical protein